MVALCNLIRHGRHPDHTPHPFSAVIRRSWLTGLTAPRRSVFARRRRRFTSMLAASALESLVFASALSLDGPLCLISDRAAAACIRWTGHC